ncbi:uncharacterized protein EKO05_0001512 [Ascochyta rabiei]|uniref:uncharacterized protein n=1 Tax=Didymella rabiei TaxID=5454 RepID=UPI0019020153|nr:uncharacterized protein EKO05_0001512 [Ascochyta rabiei]UPX10876.1 hypothetical protein EKO05_0001512 [Ascochyta rabiei]
METPLHPADMHIANPPTALGPCTCLSLTYLTLTDLQTVPSLSFPQVIFPLRKAMTAVSAVLHCPTCPLDPFSALQNVSSLTSLFKAIVSRFAKALAEVDLEAQRLRAQAARKPYRIGDNSPALSHLHTGTLDCPMGFDVELQPDVWKTLVKAALRTEMDGGGSNPTPLMRLLRETEERQARWHGDGGLLAKERRRLWGQEDCEKEELACEGLGSEHIRRVIGRLNWE